MFSTTVLDLVSDRYLVNLPYEPSGEKPDTDKECLTIGTQTDNVELYPQSRWTKKSSPASHVALWQWFTGFRSSSWPFYSVTPVMRAFVGHEDRGRLVVLGIVHVP